MPWPCKGLNRVIRQNLNSSRKAIPLELNSQATGRDKLRGAGSKEDVQLYWVYSRHVNRVILCTCSKSVHTTQKADIKHNQLLDSRSELIRPPGQDTWAHLLQSTRQGEQQHDTACTPESPWSGEKSLLFSLHSPVMKEEYSQPTPKNYAKHFVIGSLDEKIFSLMWPLNLTAYLVVNMQKVAKRTSKAPSIPVLCLVVLHRLRWEPY